MPFKIYKGEDVVTEGESPLEITGIEPNTDVAAGDYQAVRVEDDRESERVDIPAFKTLPIEIVSRETLELAIESADVGDTLTIASDFSIDSPIMIDKDIAIDGGGHTVIGNVEGDNACFRITDIASFENINIELLGEGGRAFILHTMATGFSLNDSSIMGEDTSKEGHRGVGSSIEGDGNVVIDNVEFNGLRVGVYQVGNHSLDINGSTFEDNHRGLTIEGSSVPTLTNNTFTNNDGDISVPADSEIKEEFEQEAENPDNDNTFDDDNPKYNWVTGVTLSPKTSTGEAGAAGERQLTETIVPVSAVNKAVTYAIAPTTAGLSVSNAGLISWTGAVAAGEYTTTVTTDDGDYTDTHVLTLTEPEPEPEPDPGDGEEGE